MFQTNNRKPKTKPASILKTGRKGIFRMMADERTSKSRTPGSSGGTQNAPKNLQNNSGEHIQNNSGDHPQKNSDENFSRTRDENLTKNPPNRNDGERRKNTGDPHSKNASQIQEIEDHHRIADINQQKNDIDELSIKSMEDLDEDLGKLTLMTWIGRKQNVKNVKKSLKELIEASQKVLPLGTFYSCCEHFDTYLMGGLYPAVHMTSDKKIIHRLLSNKEEFLPLNALGENNNIEQGVYSEIVSVNPPPGVKKLANNPSVIAVAAFRSTEEAVPEVLLREWKTWTGTRGFMVDILQSGLHCINVKFYVKKEPKDDPGIFAYVVTTEVEISEPNDEGLFVDVLQKFRVERFLGFRTIYKINGTDDA